MKRKYFFFDIDGTLTDKKTKEVVPSAKYTLEKLIKNGHFVTIATGRAYYKARPVMEAAGLKNMVCSGGGALVIDGCLIENHPLNFTEAVGLYKKADALGYGVLAMLDDSIKVYSHNDLFRQQCGGRKEPTEYLIDQSFDITKVQDIYKLYISVPKADEEMLLKDTSLGSLRFEKDYLMIQYDQKKDGILRMLSCVQGKAEDVVVFGDDDNDLVMFDDCWLKIAMGNACQALKDKADFVTKNNTDDGIAYACQYFGWI